MLAEFKRVTAHKKQSAVALTVIASLCAWMSCRTSDVAATPDAAVPVLPVAIEADAGIVSAPAVISTTATIAFLVSPSVRATVSWGKKQLGAIAPGKPLYVTRPRDSGPLDVVIRANGYLPVHTRAHTFSDSKVIVKLTPPDQTTTLLGYRVPIDAGVPVLGPDGLPVTGDPVVLDPLMPGSPSSAPTFLP
ncbi:MAG: hypothetical protein RLZZ450_264 [Pseudomonadota bacterium]